MLFGLASMTQAAAGAKLTEKEREFVDARHGIRHSFGAAPRKIARKASQPERERWITAPALLQHRAALQRKALLGQTNRPAGVRGPAHA